MSDSKYFEELGFYIEYPDGWEPIPTNWTVRHRKNFVKMMLGDEYSEIAGEPFFYIQKSESIQQNVFASVQASLKAYMPWHENSLEEGEAFYAELFEEFVLDCKKTVFYKNIPVNQINFYYTLFFEDGEKVELYCKIAIIYQSTFSIAIGLTCEANSDYSCIGELETIFESIIIEEII